MGTDNQKTEELPFLADGIAQIGLIVKNLEGTIELIQRPQRRVPPEKIYPEDIPSMS